MIRLKETIHVKKDIRSAFCYVSDFSNIQEWDPGVVSSQKTTEGESGLKTTYDLVLKFGLSRPKMTYSIVEYQPPARVVLKGEAQSFSAVDTISFKKTPGGTRIDYQADIQFTGPGKYMEFFLTPVLKHTGKKAITGLEQKLEQFKRIPDEKRLFSSGSGLMDFLADHTILPGMLMFSRFGYSLSSRFWSGGADTLYGRKVVLTGGTSGIGKAAAFKLARKKAFLTIIARSRKKAREITQEIIDKTGNQHIDWLQADLSMMSDIRNVAKQLRDRKKNIDILINNAGALFNERSKTPEGFEHTFATDLLGVFYLTQLLLKPLSVSSNARIINVSSGGMYTQKIDLDDLQSKAGVYNGAKAYARAKRGVVILSRVWAEEMRKYGITVHAMHPGWVDTPGIEQSLPGFHARLKKILRTPDQGADTIVWLAASKEAGRSSGLFWMDRRPHETVVIPGTGESAQERRMLREKLHRLTSGL